MQVSIARQLGLQPTTVGNFFMNARRRLHDKWQTCDYDNDDGSAKNLLSENNNENNMNNFPGNSAGIMIVDGFSNGNGSVAPGSADCSTGNGNQQRPHDLTFALEAIESIEQPPPPVCGSDTNNSDHANHTNSSCVYSLTSL